jgi:spermidine synthase
MWIALPACASALLLGTTNTLTQDVAPVPFLWVLPLALYLLTFVFAFDHPRWYSRRVMGWLMVVAVPAITWAMFQPLQDISIRQMLLIYCGGLFIACLLCHGELARLRPHPRHLTAYYLAISAGGALGGVFVSIIAPMIFTRYLEFGISLWGCCALLLVIAGTDPASWLGGLRPPIAWVGIIAGMMSLAYLVWVNDVNEQDAVLVARTRNFYGVLRVHEWTPKEDPDFKSLTLHHGRTLHGMQALKPQLRREPLTYYGPHSGVAQAMQRTENRPNRRIGAVGLGVGTVAALAKPGDTLRFYEIDPDVLHIAQTWFTYLKDSPATIDVVLGDARLSLEREPPQQFDLLILDAFSSDAIPVHLLTKEAFTIYRKHVKDTGVFAIHISNRHLDLHPVVAGLAKEFGLKVFFISRPREGVEFPSTWAIMGKSNSPLPPRGDEILWTDDRANLLSILKGPQEDDAPAGGR